MKIRPKDIVGEDVQFHGVVNQESLGIDTDYWWLNTDVDVTITGNRIKEYIRLDIKAKAYITTMCCRCLKETQRDVVVGFSFQKQIMDELEDIDVASLVREELILSMGLRHLCSEDCKGICPGCGQDLNEGECKCSVD